MAAVLIVFMLILRKIMKVSISWAPFLYYTGSGLAAALPVIIYFLLYSDIEAVISNLILFPLSEFQEFQSIPHPTYLSLFTLPFFVFPLVLLIGLSVAFVFMKRRMDHTLTYGILLISLIGIVFFKQASARSDIVHLLPLGLTSVLLAPILLHALPKELSFSIIQYTST